MIDAIINGILTGLSLYILFFLIMAIFAFLETYWKIIVIFLVVIIGIMMLIWILANIIDKKSIKKSLLSFEIRTKKKLIRKAKNTKLYLISGIILLIIACFSIFIFLMGIYNNIYMWDFLILGVIILYFGIFYLMIHKRFHNAKKL